MDEMKNTIDWNRELLEHGFVSLESTTRTYGNGKFTGSICDEHWDGKFFTIAEKKGKNTKEVFCPFLRGAESNRPNFKFNEVRLRSIEDLEKYLMPE